MTAYRKIRLRALMDTFEGERPSSPTRRNNRDTIPVNISKVLRRVLHMRGTLSQPTRRTLAKGLRQRILALPGVEERSLHLRHAVVPKAYWIAGIEFVHFHGSQQLDMRIPDAALRTEILRDPRAKVNPFARSRVEFDFTSAEDADDAFRLVERVHRLSNAATSRLSGPPIFGRLARRNSGDAVVTRCGRSDASAI